MPFLLALLSLLLSPPATADTCGQPTACVTDLQAAVGTARDVAYSPGGQSDLAYDAFQAQGLRPEVLELALTAYQKAWQQGDTRKQVITVIDYSLPSNQKRLWVIDLSSNQLLFHEHVAHGSGSGMTTPTRFSNRNNSHKSNLGLLKTAETYYGKHGYSLKLDGLEHGWNDKARSRYIVMHSADYMTDSYIEANGRAGRSWGCPALDPDISRAVIDAIKGGSLVFGYYPDQKWLSGSSYLN